MSRKTARSRGGIRRSAAYTSSHSANVPNGNRFPSSSRLRTPDFEEDLASINPPSSPAKKSEEFDWTRWTTKYDLDDAFKVDTPQKIGQLSGPKSISPIKMPKFSPGAGSSLKMLFDSSGGYVDLPPPPTPIKVEVLYPNVAATGGLPASSPNIHTTAAAASNLSQSETKEVGPAEEETQPVNGSKRTRNEDDESEDDQSKRVRMSSPDEVATPATDESESTLCDTIFEDGGSAHFSAESPATSTGEADTTQGQLTLGEHNAQTAAVSSNNAEGSSTIGLRTAWRANPTVIDLTESDGEEVIDLTGSDDEDEIEIVEHEVAHLGATQSTSRLVLPINANEFKTLFDRLTDEGKIRFGEILQGAGNTEFTQFSMEDTAILRDLSALLIPSPSTARVNTGTAAPIAATSSAARLSRPELQRSIHTQAQTNPSTSDISGSGGSGNHPGSSQDPQQTPAYENIRFEYYVPPPEQDAPAQATPRTGNTYNGPTYNYNGPVYNGPLTNYPGYQQPMNSGTHQAPLPGHSYIANGYNQHNAWGAYGAQQPDPHYAYGYTVPPSTYQSTGGEGADHYRRGPLPPVLLSTTESTNAPNGYYPNAHYYGN
ncbi:hypothetical protein NMY22_g11442 [Coprinellus aureogranulatus]|nr:hypothetical protein NMY22_g11442 [Coprinellus aureogranulatus]